MRTVIKAYELNNEIINEMRKIVDVMFELLNQYYANLNHSNPKEVSEYSDLLNARINLMTAQTDLLNVYKCRMDQFGAFHPNIHIVANNLALIHEQVLKSEQYYGVNLDYSNQKQKDIEAHIKLTGEVLPSLKKVTAYIQAQSNQTKEAEEKRKLVTLPPIREFPSTVTPIVTSNPISAYNNIGSENLTTPKKVNYPSHNQNIKSKYSETDAKKFLQVVTKLSEAGEKDAVRWISKMEKNGYKITFISSSNGEVWSETNSVYGDTLCAVRMSETAFVVPSPSDTQLRSASIPAWFNIRGSGSKIRIEQIAIGVVNSGSYHVHKKGLISL